VKFVHEAFKSPGSLDRVQVLALDVFHERHFQCELVGHFANDRRDFG